MSVTVRTVNLPQPEWDLPKKNEKEIYSEFGRLVVETQSVVFAVIEMITWFYVKNGMGNKAHAIQIMLNREDLLKTLEVFVNTIDYIYSPSEDEIKILNQWKASVIQISQFRNNLVHSKWATGWVSMTEEWNIAKVFSPRRRRVGTDLREITKEIITEQRQVLSDQMDLVFCIFRCLVTYEKSFLEYFTFVNNRFAFDSVKWHLFEKMEYENAKKLAQGRTDVIFM